MNKIKKFISFFQTVLNKNINNDNFSIDLNKINNFLKKTKNAKNILIIGDYDVDGITSSVFLKRFLNKYTNADTNVYIPSRYDGYSVSPEFLYVNLNSYDTVVFADNGTDKKLFDVIKELKAENKVFIFDHHPNDDVKDEIFLINPAVSENFNGISTGILFHKIYKSVYPLLKMNKYSFEENEFNHIFAMSAIADMANLNNIYTRKVILDGINKIKSENNDFFSLINKEKILNDLSFKIIPMINAGGRLLDNENINKIEWDDFLFSGKNFKKIYYYLQEINKFRKEAVSFFYKEALKQYNGEKIFVCKLENCPHGINGNIAQKFAQKGINAVIFSENIQEPGTLIGSARGKGNLKKVAQKVMKHFNEGHLGGHNNAFGMTIPDKIFDDVKKEFEKHKNLLEFEDNFIIYDEKINFKEYIEINKIIEKITKNIPLSKECMPVVQVQYNPGDFYIKKNYGEYCILNYKTEKDFLILTDYAQKILTDKQGYFKVTSDTDNMEYVEKDIVRNNKKSVFKNLKTSKKKTSLSTVKG